MATDTINLTSTQSRTKTHHVPAGRSIMTVQVSPGTLGWGTAGTEAVVSAEWCLDPKESEWVPIDPARVITAVGTEPAGDRIPCSGLKFMRLAVTTADADADPVAKVYAVFS